MRRQFLRGLDLHSREYFPNNGRKDGEEILPHKKGTFVLNFVIQLDLCFPYPSFRYVITKKNHYEVLTTSASASIAVIRNSTETNTANTAKLRDKYDEYPVHGLKPYEYIAISKRHYNITI